jgi:hypothetical protein
MMKVIVLLYYQYFPLMMIMYNYHLLLHHHQIKQQSQITKNSTTDSFPSLKALTTISETSEFSSSRTSSVSSTQLTSPIKDIPTDTSPIDSNKSPKSSILNSRSSPEVHVLDVTDLTDPGLRITSKFSFKDPDDKLTIAINGK